MRENSKQFKVYLKGIIDEVEDDMTIHVIGGTSKSPVPDEENLESITQDLFAFIKSLSDTDKLDLSIIAKVVED